MGGYKWKLAGLAKGVDVNLVIDELNQLQNENETLTPDLIVRAASNENSILHRLFEWDDNKAAYHWRLQQARIILNNIDVVVLSDGEERNISVFEVTTRAEGYKSIDTFTVEDIDFIRSNTLRQLNTMRTKLKLYKEFDKIVYHLEKAIEEI